MISIVILLATDNDAVMLSDSPTVVNAATTSKIAY